MKFAILALFTAASISSVFAESTPGINFKFNLTNQKFTLEVDAVLGEQITLDEAKKILSNPDSLTAVSEVVKSAKLKAGKSPGNSTLYTTWVRYHIQKNLVTDCQDAETSTHWNSTCTLRVIPDLSDPDDRGQTQSLFFSGGSSMDCVQPSAHTNVLCQIKTWGQAKEQHIAFIKKSAASLALDGAGFSLHDFGLLVQSLNEGKSIRDELRAYPQSPLQELVDSFAQEANPLVNNRNLPAGKALEAKGDSRIGDRSFKLEIN